MKSYLPIIASLFLVSTPLVLPATASETEIIAQEINPYIEDNIARQISVKIFSADNGGSGVIIAQKDNTYLVLTNNHVLRDGKEFTIDTHDGVTHQAVEVVQAIATDDDLALLQFTSDNDYQTATINTAATPKAEQTILAVGYSAETGELVTESGKIERVPDKTLKEGYQIGYTSNMVQGMSGGAILNTNGEVIGINGKSAFPIVNGGYNSEDGKQPNAEEIEQLRQLSWGLSINRLLAQVNPEIITAYNLPLPETKGEVKTPLTGWLGELEAKAKQITVRIDSSSGANGSGVIIAKEGNTYAVLTADHVICESEPQARDCIDYSYEILAPDGQKYPVDIDTVKRQEGVDLAVLKFTSNEEYQVAELANYPLIDDDAVFVAGYPKLSQNTPAQWLFSLGYGSDPEQGLFQVSDNSLKNDSSDLLGGQAGSLAGGYEMVYSNITYGGMSGGAVLDKDGRVIGIHGLAEGQTALNSQGGSATQIQLGYSLGIPLNTFVGLADRLGMAGLPVQENRPRALDKREVESFQAAILGAEISQSNAQPETWLERGNQLWRLGLYSQAVEAFERAIALNPEFVYLAHYGKGLALWHGGKTETALASLELATEIEPNFAPAFYHKHGLLKSLDRLESALVAIETAISLQPDNANFYIAQGGILAELKRYKEAEVALNKAIDLNPRSSFYNNRGILYSDQGKLELALSDFDQALAINPKSARAYNNRGILYSDQGKLELALSDYNQAIAINPNYAKAHNNRGILYSDQGKLELALSDLNQAIAINPKSANAHHNRASLYKDQGKLELALSDLNQAIAINPKFTSAYNNRARVYSNKGKLELALSDLNQAIAINPNDADAYNNRAGVYLNQGKLELTLSDLKQAIAINPKLASAHYNRAGVYKNLGKLELALFDYSQALAINPNSADAYYNRGNIYQIQGKLELALSDYNQAIAINPRYADAYNNRANVYLDQGKLALTLSDLNQALAINPNDAKVYVNRGLVYQNYKKLELALSDYNQAITINPNYAKAYYHLGLIHIKLRNIEKAKLNFEKAQQLYIAQGNTQGEEQTEDLLQQLSKLGQSEFSHNIRNNAKKYRSGKKSNRCF